LLGISANDLRRPEPLLTHTVGGSIAADASLVTCCIVHIPTSNAGSGPLLEHHFPHDPTHVVLDRSLIGMTHIMKRNTTG